MALQEEQGALNAQRNVGGKNQLNIHRLRGRGKRREQERNGADQASCDTIQVGASFYLILLRNDPPNTALMGASATIPRQDGMVDPKTTFLGSAFETSGRCGLVSRIGPAMSFHGSYKCRDRR